MTDAEKKAAEGEEEFKTTLPRVDGGKLFTEKVSSKSAPSSMAQKNKLLK